MVNTGGDITEFSVQVVMRKSSKNAIENIPFQIFNRKKDKKLRVLSSSQVPLMQLISTTNGSVKEINISKAAKVFRGFSTQKDENCLKLILKGKILTLYHSEENQYNQCAETINMILQRFHKIKRSSIISTISNYENKITDISDNNIRSSEENISSGDTSSSASSSAIYSPIIINENQKEMKNFDTYVTIKLNEDNTIVKEDLETHLTMPKERYEQISFDNYKLVFQNDYEVPNFDERTSALPSGYDSSEMTTKMRTFRCKNPQIFHVMKLREEIGNSGGVQVQLSCELNAVVSIKEIGGAFWVASISQWDEIEGKLHIGDRILSVNGQQIYDIVQFQQLTKRANNYSIKIQRLPKARAFVFDRTVSDAKRCISYKKKSFTFSDDAKIKWEITEVNRKNTVNIVDPNQIENIQAIINSNLRYIILIIHPLDFMKSIRSK